MFQRISFKVNISSHSCATAKLAKGLAVSVGVAATAIGGIGAASINVASQFEASMSQVAATMGMTADEANYNNEVYAMLANRAKV